MIALFGVLVWSQLVMIPLSLTVQFRWGLAPPGRLVLSVLIALLMLPTGAIVAMRPRPRLASVAIALALAVIPLIGFGSTWPVVSLAIFIAGLVSLEVGAVIAGRRIGHRAAWLPGLLTGFTVFLALVTWLLFFGPFSGLSVDTVFLNQRSPDGAWTVIGVESDQGAIGGNVSIQIERSLAGIIEQGRTVFVGDWGARPVITWLDANTISIDGKKLRLYRDPAIDGYSQ